MKLIKCERCEAYVHYCCYGLSKNTRKFICDKCKISPNLIQVNTFNLIANNT